MIFKLYKLLKTMLQPRVSQFFFFLNCTWSLCSQAIFCLNLLFRTKCDRQTSVCSADNVNSSVQQTAASLLNPAGYCYWGPALWDGSLMTVKLKTDFHSTHQSIYNLSIWRKTKHVSIPNNCLLQNLILILYLQISPLD